MRGLHGRGPFDLGFPVAVKTGTSSGFRDTWTAGYTHERTVAVWVGNSDGAPTRRSPARAAPAALRRRHARAMRDVPARAPLWDASLLETAEVCPLSGKLAARPAPTTPSVALPAATRRPRAATSTSSHPLRRTETS